jgi:glycerate dehydrogenase
MGPYPPFPRSAESGPTRTAALRAGTIAAAATDVLDCEPPPPDHPLLHAPHCLVTPHIAWYALQSRQRLLETAVANLKTFLAGTPHHVVNQ